LHDPVRDSHPPKAGSTVPPISTPFCQVSNAIGVFLASVAQRQSPAVALLINDGFLPEVGDADGSQLRFNTATSRN